MVEIGVCEYCDKPNVPVVSTPELGCYCKECLKLAADNCKAAISDINAFEQSHKISKKSHKNTKVNLAELERKKDEALAKLMAGQTY
jgi:hypothetical protein